MSWHAERIHMLGSLLWIHIFGASVGGPERACNKGWRALTTMLMFGLKSASYCTHKAATAAICFQQKPRCQANVSYYYYHSFWYRHSRSSDPCELQYMVKRAASKKKKSYFSFLIVPSLPPKLCFFKVSQFVLDTLSVNLCCGTSVPTFFFIFWFLFFLKNISPLWLL